MTTTISSLSLPSLRAISYALTTASSDPDPDVDVPTILLSNSLCALFTSWDHVVPKLTSRGFNVLRYDQPGHGDSTAPEDLSSTTFHTLADDVRVLLDHLSITRLHGWVGVSMGAAIGMVFAAKYPNVVQKLIVCDTISCSPTNIGAADVFGPRVAAARDVGKMDGIVDATLERWFGSAWMDTNPDETSRMRDLMLKTTIDGFETCCAALRSQTFDLRPLAMEAGQGVDEALFLVGEKDANLPETMQQLRKGVEQGLRKKDGNASVDLHVIKSAGHVCYVDGYDEFIATVTHFLGR
ncbi:zearalenone lactonase [Annulohypoxylon maeteangense]|uniref:zearalenone lactonase n=1 Tax=Annulohypoxylon maeteangense TaxID=1927788 RepID=UPI0020075E46|nr:zearalenone lactonase [Annulohypoxylon maeteangense]KAI0883016.1 zearalenone lactonase [Annulohypoxylon maeteangense]